MHTLLIFIFSPVPGLAYYDSISNFTFFILELNGTSIFNFFSMRNILGFGDSFYYSV